MSEDLELALFRAAADALRSVPSHERADTYVVSFFIYDEDDDPRLPTITFGTNTESQVELASNPPADVVKPNPWWTPADPAEARWNYAFWLQNDLGVFGKPGRDAAGAAAIEEWLRASGRWIDEPDDDGDWDAFDAAGSEITRAFVAVCSRVSLRLHSEGVVDEVFGRPIPVVIHELEYYDEIADQTKAANPSGLVDDFVAWVRDA